MRDPWAVLGYLPRALADVPPPAARPTSTYTITVRPLSSSPSSTRAETDDLPPLADDMGTASYPFGLILYYVWSVATLVILLNVLVALFSSSCASSSPSLALASSLAHSLAPRHTVSTAHERRH